LLNQGKNIGAALKLELSPRARAFISTRCINWNKQYQAGTLDLLQQVYGITETVFWSTVGCNYSGRGSQPHIWGKKKYECRVERLCKRQLSIVNLICLQYSWKFVFF
jgi:hypothetical protein